MRREKSIRGGEGQLLVAKMEIYDTNKVEIAGRVATLPAFNHEVYGEKFYGFFLETERLSGYVDTLPMMISGRYLEEEDIHPGDFITVEGQVRSYNRIVETVSRLELNIFVRKMLKSEGVHRNFVTLIGYICKPPTYRVTPFGREITDMLIAVNRSYNKSDYIPVIVWGRNARYARLLDVGKKLKLTGRMQSREYEKVLPDGDRLTRVAYEVSISALTSDVEEESL